MAARKWVARLDNRAAPFYLYKCRIAYLQLIIRMSECLNIGNKVK